MGSTGRLRMPCRAPTANNGSLPVMDGHLQPPPRKTSADEHRFCANRVQREALPAAASSDRDPTSMLVRPCGQTENIQASLSWCLSIACRKRAGVKRRWHQKPRWRPLRLTPLLSGIRGTLFPVFVVFCFELLVAFSLGVRQRAVSQHTHEVLVHIPGAKEIWPNLDEVERILDRYCVASAEPFSDV